MLKLIENWLVELWAVFSVWEQTLVAGLCELGSNLGVGTCSWLTYCFYKVVFLAAVNVPLFTLQHNEMHKVKIAIASQAKEI